MSDQGDDSLSMLIRNSIWATPPVTVDPIIELTRWRVLEILSGPRQGERHFIGFNLGYPEGRVSSAIKNFDFTTGRGTTRSGRIYQLVGVSSYDRDGEWVWSRWRDMHAATEVRDVSEEYTSRPEDPHAAPELDDAERLELSQLVGKIFSAWGLVDEQRRQVLGVNVEEGSPLPADPHLIDRALDIATIYELLHAGNLDRPDLADGWPTQPSPVFRGKTPIEVMEAEGPGIVRLLLQADMM